VRVRCTILLWPSLSVGGVALYLPISRLQPLLRRPCGPPFKSVVTRPNGGACGLTAALASACAADQRGRLHCQRNGIRRRDRGSSAEEIILPWGSLSSVEPMPN